MQDELSDRIKSFLDRHRLGVLSPAGGPGTWAVPIRRLEPGLELVCLLPRWSDALYHLEQNTQVEIVILDAADKPLCWLLVSGQSRLMSDDLERGSLDDSYAAVLVVPGRIDLFDERRGWGARETLEIGD